MIGMGCEVNLGASLMVTKNCEINTSESMHVRVGDDCSLRRTLKSGRMIFTRSMMWRAERG